MNKDSWMSKPTHPNVTVEEVRGMSDEQWLKLVGDLAFPQRSKTMVQAVKLAMESQAQCMVETGCIRGWAGDGQSTLILAMYACRTENGFAVDTFDTSETHITNCQGWLGPFNAYVEFNHIDSVTGLGQHQKPIDFAYLDSYDYNSTNPRECQLHQLAEVGAIYGKLTEKAIIVMDDANLQGGGKVAMSRDFLKSRGWKEVANDYQLVMQR